MSLNGMANSAAARRVDLAPLNVVPRSLGEIARAAITPPSDTQTRSITTTTAPVDTTFNVLFGYMPTEIMTVYVAVLAAIQQAGKVTPGDWVTFWIFLVATPLVLWMVFAAKIRSAGKPLPMGFRTWPLWEMVAATLAFAAWAFALPHSPFTEYKWYSSGLSGLSVMIASTVLGLMAPFFQNPLTGTTAPTPEKHDIQDPLIVEPAPTPDPHVSKDHDA